MDRNASHKYPESFNSYIYDTFRPTGRKSSVYYDDTRLNKAKEEIKKEKIDKKEIIKFTNDFFDNLGLKTVSEPECKIKNLINNEGYLTNEFYYEAFAKNSIKPKYIKDIIWMSFTKCGYLAVVGTSNDIDYEIPPSLEEYEAMKQNKKRKCAPTTILVWQLEKEFDLDKILVFPLQSVHDGADIPTGSRKHIECGVGNFLINRKVPIIDYYSHRYKLRLERRNGDSQKNCF